MSYPASIIPDQWRIAGLRLVPLTMGHAALGERMGLPYFAGGDSSELAEGSLHDGPMAQSPNRPSAGPGDLAMALFICSRPWRKAVDKLQRNQGALRRRFIMWLLGEVESFDHHQNQFLRYLEAQFKSPDTWTKGEAKGCAAPPMLSLRARLIADLRVGWSESLDIPIAEALWLSAAQAEREGGIDWVTANERNAMQAAMAAARQANGPTASPEGQKEEAKV